MYAPTYSQSTKIFYNTNNIFGMKDTIWTHCNNQGIILQCNNLIGTIITVMVSNYSTSRY